MNHYRNHQTQCINNDVPLASADLLACVVTPLYTTNFRRFYRRTVDDHCRWSRLSARRHPHLTHQGIVHAFPGSIVPPFPIIVVHRFPLGKVVGQMAPLATGAIEIQDRINDPAAVDGLSSCWFRRGKMLFEQRPLNVGQVCGIMHSGRGTLHCSRLWKIKTIAVPRPVFNATKVCKTS